MRSTGRRLRRACIRVRLCSEWQLELRQNGRRWTDEAAHLTQDRRRQRRSVRGAVVVAFFHFVSLALVALAIRTLAAIATPERRL